MKFLDKIDSPADVRKLTPEQLVELAEEVRQEIVSAVSQTGGHLATNLGAVELTLALHHVFDLPTDKLVWDVSHQVYAHKLLTGRRDRFHTIRQYHGLAGFTKREESEYDIYGAGHASTAISAALGIAAARDNVGKTFKVVAVIGDGSLTGGLAFEGLNNVGTSRKDMLVILNDNAWSISKNVGAMSKYLTSIMADEKFNRLRDEIWELTGRFKRRDKIRSAISRIEGSIKGMLVPGGIFQNLGFRYFGPIDGHDLPLVIKTLQSLKSIGGPVILHLVTVKGKGYAPAESDPASYHGVGKFDKVTGKPNKKSGLPAYTKVFGDTMMQLAAKDQRVIAITAAMASGTGLDGFAKEYPDRFFDVGIAEAHAGCFAGGLAAEGARPYMVVYSTFLQRAYDQIIHDIALQKLPVVFCIDRAGLVGEDGPTHHGVFDLSYLSAVPNLTLAAPKDGDELRSMLHYTCDNELDGPVAIRFPRAPIPYALSDKPAALDWGRWETCTPLGDTVVLAVGTMVTTALEAKEILADRGIELSVVNARFIQPLDLDCLDKVRESAKRILTLEENVLRGGFGQTIGAYLMSHGYRGGFKAMGIPDRFVTHGARASLLKEINLDTESVADSIANLVQPDESNGGFLHKLIFRRNEAARKKSVTERSHLVESDNKG